MLQIVNWNKHFEGAKSKTYNNKTSCQLPTKHGLGYRRLVRMKNGPAMFGAWCALIQVLSRHGKPRNGYLTDDGTLDGMPLTAFDLEMLTDIPESVFASLFTAAKSDKIGWIQPLKDTVGNQEDTTGDQPDTTGPLHLDLDLDLDLDSNTPDEPAWLDFENAWIAYDRKGSKKQALLQWKKLTEEQRFAAAEGIEPYFEETPDRNFRKDFERYLSHRVFESVLERKASAPTNKPKDYSL